MPLQVTFLAQWASIDIVIATRQFRDNVFDPQIIYMAHTFFLPIQVGTHREALGGRGPTTAFLAGSATNNCWNHASVNN